jgi:hypothetical protein
MTGGQKGKRRRRSTEAGRGSGVCTDSSQNLWSRLLTRSSSACGASKSAARVGEMAETHNVIRPLGLLQGGGRGRCRNGRMCRMGA